MNILIIEDEKAAVNRLINQIRELRPHYSILACIGNAESAIEWFSSNPSPDLIFLDIQLSDGLCFKIFEQVKIKVPVIFTTAFDSFALKAFELNSIDYLLKPVNINKLEQAINKFELINNQSYPGILEGQMFKLMTSIQSGNTIYKTRFLIPLSDGYIPILTNTIAYFCADNNNIIITTNKNEKFSYHYTLDKLEKELDPAQFWRANRAYIVSAWSIKKAHNYFNYKIKLDINPDNPDDVIISRNKVVEFKKWFNN